jgi:5-methylcytosine-specific restriction enzyme B
MEAKRTIELIDIIRQIQLNVQDITNDQERVEERRKVRVKYQFGSSTYESEDLFTKRVTADGRVQNAKDIEAHFTSPVFWLDIDHHEWPQGSGESDLEWRVIPEICGKNIEFENFLKKLVNNAQTGWIQEITKDGQRGQYYHNLVNNNHWHDLILMIQAFIKTKGAAIDEKYFAPLVFEWQGEKGNKKRVSLSRHFGGRRMIDLLQENIKSAFKIIDTMADTSEVIRLLEHKPQVILQGPPGTGKTRLAKEVAQKLCRNGEAVEIDSNFINEHLYVGLELSTLKDGNKFLITELAEGIRIKLNNGGEYSASRERIITALKNNDLNKTLGDEYRQNVGPYILGIARYLNDKASESNIKIIQFHPSYSYEDFVRGITTKVTDGQIKYEAVNKILGEFAQQAYKNFVDSRKDSKALSKEKWIEEMLDQYADTIEEKLTTDGKYPIGDTIIYIFEVEEDAFRYKGDNWKGHEGGLRMKFKQLADLYVQNILTRQDIKKIPGLKGLVKEHATYYIKVLHDFREFLKTKPAFTQQSLSVREKKYVLIIDEINRANLSSVLGELIYGLEYRGNPVESLYEVEKDRELILPPNLFIIGTMNTADRSVGHIDYAIRRRFSFFSVLPDGNVVQEKGSARAVDLFKKMSKLFRKENESSITYLSPEFSWEDVMIGHSYFLEKDDEKLNTRLQYEIEPILKEYIKDGILLEGAWAEIKKW